MSSESSPSPPAQSSLKAPTAEQSEVRITKEEEDAINEHTGGQSSSAVLPNIKGLDLSVLYQIQSNPAFRAFLTANAPAIVNQLNPPSTPQTPSTKQQVPQSEGSLTKKTRLKVFSNGFFMTYDKLSSCGQKHFWRCEYKNTCKARMHTDLASEKILSVIHTHNHKAPTPDEILLYGLDPEKVERDRVYTVETPADPNLRRKIRKQVADREAAIKRMEAVKQEEDELQQSQNAINASQAALRAASVYTGLGSSVASNPAAAMANAFSGSTGAAMSSMLMAHLPFIKQEASFPAPVSPGLPCSSFPTNTVVPVVSRNDDLLTVMKSKGPAKRRAHEYTTSSDEDEAKRDPQDPTFEIARKLRKLWKGEPSRYPRTTANATTHFDFFIAKDDGSDEHLYVPIQIKQRDEMHLKEALQKFVNSQCIGMLLFGVSPKISVMFNQPMLASWDNNQYFLLNVSNPSRWRLMYVDDRAI